MEQTEWDSSYDSTVIRSADDNHPVTTLIKHYFAHTAGQLQTVYEVGCFPGTFLSVFGALGYELHGSDLTPRLEEMKDFFRRQTFAVGSIDNSDFFLASDTTKYDVVCSFGFIEHFPNYPAVIKKHARLVKDGGHLLITTPNFRGFVQQLFHRLADRKNLSKHHLPAMNPPEWAAQLEAAGFEILYSGYIGRFDFWSEPDTRGVVERGLLFAVRVVSYGLKRLVFFDSQALSPFCAIVARKKAGS